MNSNRQTTDLDNFKDKNEYIFDLLVDNKITEEERMGRMVSLVEEICTNRYNSAENQTHYKELSKILNKYDNINFIGKTWAQPGSVSFESKNKCLNNLVEKLTTSTESKSLVRKDIDHHLKELLSNNCPNAYNAVEDKINEQETVKEYIHACDNLIKISKESIDNINIKPKKNLNTTPDSSGTRNTDTNNSKQHSSATAIHTQATELKTKLTDDNKTNADKIKDFKDYYNDTAKKQFEEHKTGVSKKFYHIVAWVEKKINKSESGLSAKLKNKLIPVLNNSHTYQLFKATKAVTTFDNKISEQNIKRPNKI